MIMGFTRSQGDALVGLACIGIGGGICYGAYLLIPPVVLQTIGGLLLGSLGIIVILGGIGEIVNR